MTASLSAERTPPIRPNRPRQFRARVLAGAALTILALVIAELPAGAAVTEDPTTTTTAPAPAPPPPPAPPAPPTVGPSGLPYLGPVLATGSTGVEVLILQFALVRRGFWLNEQLGRFGESTHHALVAFQKYYGMARTGRVDFWTRLVLAGEPVRATPLSWATGHRIDVDLNRQVLVVSTDATVEGVFDISSGKSSTRTPRGTFRLQREIRGRRVSSLGTLWSPKYFTGGYAIHGSPSVPTYPASHGCVRMTNQTIDYLWASGLIPLGTTIRLW